MLVCTLQESVSKLQLATPSNALTTIAIHGNGWAIVGVPAEMHET